MLGILLGAWLYAEVYPWFKATVLTVGAWGKLTWPGLLGVNHWAVIVPLVALGTLGLIWLDRRGR